MFSPLPFPGLLHGGPLRQMMTVATFRETVASRWRALLLPEWQDVELLSVRPEFLQEEPEPMMEGLCLWLEKSFRDDATACLCCREELPRR